VVNTALRKRPLFKCMKMGKLDNEEAPRFAGPATSCKKPLTTEDTESTEDFGGKALGFSISLAISKS
jgi:hypothetical protein